MGSEKGVEFIGLPDIGISYKCQDIELHPVSPQKIDFAQYLLEAAVSVG